MNNTNTAFFFTLKPTLFMFDFEKLTIYEKAKTLNAQTRKFILTSKLDPLPKINSDEQLLVSCLTLQKVPEDSPKPINEISMSLPGVQSSNVLLFLTC